MTPISSTDHAWEEWGRRDPYFSVITHPKFRRNVMTEEARLEFLESGKQHVEYVMAMIRHYIDPQFQPRSILDFGCGVGRVVIPFASLAGRAVGMDVSVSMLAEARRNCEELGVSGIEWVESDDQLSRLAESFDLVHSFIVFQHIPPRRGRDIFRRLIEKINPGGVGAVQVCYSKSHFAGNWGNPPANSSSNDLDAVSGNAIELPPGVDPEMQMNSYNVTELLFLIQAAGVHRLHLEFTDHGGELGLFLFFQRPHSRPADSGTP